MPDRRLPSLVLLAALAFLTTGAAQAVHLHEEEAECGCRHEDQRERQHDHSKCGLCQLMVSAKTIVPDLSDQVVVGLDVTDRVISISSQVQWPRDFEGEPVAPRAPPQA